jgi:alkylation response protein AidB-like acyl-CoA dehydrogenase
MYNLTEEQQLLQTAVREFVRDHIEPIAEESDRTGEYPAETMKKLAEMDLLAIPYPAEYGGAGADYVSYVIAIEEISRACPGTATVLMAHTLMQYPIYKYGTPEQKAKFLPRLAKLQDLGAFALTEPNAGTDAGSLQTTARLEGDYWILNGSKTFITNGDMAGITIVLARTSEDQEPGGSVALLSRRAYLIIPSAAMKTKWELGHLTPPSSSLKTPRCQRKINSVLWAEGSLWPWKCSRADVSGLPLRPPVARKVCSTRQSSTPKNASNSGALFARTRQFSG